jgi:hypothetical protein
MASNARIFTTDGKSLDGAKTFGITVSDRQTVPNLSQLTFVPAGSSTLQNHRFVIGGSLTGDDSSQPTNHVSSAIGNDGAANTNITAIPNLTLDTKRFYQFSAHLTIVIQPTSGTFVSGTYVLTSAAKGVGLIGAGYGYRLDTICSETTMDTYINESCIVLDVNSSKFRIQITPITSVDFSIDIMTDVTINSALFSP